MVIGYPIGPTGLSSRNAANERIGVPKQIKADEHRVALTPGGKITYRPVSEAHGLEVTPLEDVCSRPGFTVPRPSE